MAGVVVPVTAPDAFANADDLALFWKTLTGEDINRANNLLKLASNRLRSMGTSSDVDVNAKVNSDPVYFSNVQWVVMEAVKRAMLTPIDLPPVDTFQQTAGPYSENIKYSNPSGDLWFKRSELSDLGLNGKQTLDSISSTPRWDIYQS